MCFVFTVEMTPTKRYDASSKLVYNIYRKWVAGHDEANTLIFVNERKMPTFITISSMPTYIYWADCPNNSCTSKSKAAINQSRDDKKNLPKKMYIKMKNIRLIKHVKLNGEFIRCEKQCDFCHIYHSTQLNAYAIANTHGQSSCLYLMPSSIYMLYWIVGCCESSLASG